MAGTGIVIRDFDGEVIAALTERITLPPSVEEVEALACRRAISFAAEIGLRDVVIEGDSVSNTTPQIWSAWLHLVIWWRIRSVLLKSSTIVPFLM